MFLYIENSSWHVGGNFIDRFSGKKLRKFILDRTSLAWWGMESFFEKGCVVSFAATDMIGIIFFMQGQLFSSVEATKKNVDFLHGAMPSPTLWTSCMHRESPVLSGLCQKKLHASRARLGLSLPRRRFWSRWSGSISNPDQSTVSGNEVKSCRIIFASGSVI